MKFAALIMGLAVTVGAVAIGHEAHSQDFPGKPIRMIVPFSAGGPTDIISRTFAEGLGKELGTTVLVENKVGGAAMIGTRAALEQPSDGYTLLMGTTSLGTTKLTYKDPGFDLDDFRVIAPIGFQNFILSINTVEKTKTLGEMIDYAKANPGALKNASLAEGSPMYFLAKRLEHFAGVKFTDITYPGSTPAMNDVIGGHVQIIFNGPLTTMPMVEAGKLTPLAISSEERISLAPEIPTFKELGYPQVTGGVWFAVVIAADTPDDIAAKLTEAGQKVAASDAMKAQLDKIAIEHWSRSVPEFETVIKEDRRLWEEDAARLGIQPQ
jgi:tripartite-type tricarboxylate transporter receptor subunit TctC